MRDFKGMKRQRGRNRGGGGGGKPQHNANRSFDSNGPEGIKVRGAAQGVFEKYTQLARDASSSGDRVLAENYLQHAEHYFRVVRAMQPQRPPSEILGKEGYSGGFDIDFEAEPEEATVEAAEATEGAAEGEGGEGGQRERNFDNNGRREDRPRFENRDRQDRDRDRQDRGPREDRGERNFESRDNREGGRRDRWRDRDDRPRDRDDRPREDRPPREDRGPREDRPERSFERDDRSREDRPRRERYDRGEREPRESVVAEAPAARDDEPSSPRLRGQDGAVSEAPAFLSRGPAAPTPAPVADEAAAPKPRRTRARKTVVSEGED